MEHRKLNFAIPLYFDNSVSYLELVGHLSKGFEDIHQEFEEIKVDWSKIQTEFTLVKQDWEALEQFKTDLTNQEAQHVADMNQRADAFEAEIRAQQEQHEQKVDGIVGTFNGRITTLENDVADIKDGTITVENANHADVADKLSTARTISLTGDVVIPEKTVAGTEPGNQESFHRKYWYKISGRYNSAVRRMQCITVSCLPDGCMAGHTAERECRRAKRYLVHHLYLKARWKRQGQPSHFGPSCHAG